MNIKNSIKEIFNNVKRKYLTQSDEDFPGNLLHRINQLRVKLTKHKIKKKDQICWKKVRRKIRRKTIHEI